jgi:phosphoglycolate phosphatase-like HAD superfamily hydrolase
MQLVKNAMPVRVVVFDYDGTLVDSNAIKREAYRRLFSEGPFHDNLLAAVLDRNPAGTRHDIIGDMLAAMHPSTANAEFLRKERERLAAQYDRVATEGAATCAERPGAGAGLAFLAGRRPLYLLSTTPEESLRRIVARRGWTAFFRVVRGAPCCKAGELRTFATAEGVRCDEVLMVGDSEADRKAALDAGTDFLHMAEGMTMEAVFARIGMAMPVSGRAECGGSERCSVQGRMAASTTGRS